ncbi:MAG: hypothetical protein D6706_05165 [Chloroflexi bacterium]|nr:MAG: hypothetical protein D6706_05165 [Chloroflexota bacterium]
MHAALKAWYARPTDRLEQVVDGFVIDIVRGELLIEIQTGNFASLRRKLRVLVEKYPVRLVYPIAAEKWIVKRPFPGHTAPSRRKSPVRGSYAHLFQQLVSFPALLAHPNFSLDVVLIQEEEWRYHDSSRAWRRRGWRTEERRLLAVLETRLFAGREDLLIFIPPEEKRPFTTADLASYHHIPRPLAQKMAYCLHHINLVQRIGKQGNAYLYA